MRPITWQQAHGRRLARSHLLEPAPREHLTRVVRDVGGVQAQLLSAAELALSARVAGLTAADVAVELWERRSLIKAWAQRGTLHLLPADELPLWTAEARLGPYWRETEWLERHGLRLAQAEAVRVAIGEALDGRCLTREELAEEVVGRVGDWAHEPLLSQWGELLGPAAATGLLCFGPSRGAKVTFTRADRWVALWSEPDPEDARAEIFRRYLHAYGPSTPRDFARWYGCEPRDARALTERLADEIEEVGVEGTRMLFLRGEQPASWPAPRGVRLLAQYDCYVIGSRPHERLVPDEGRERIRAHGRGRYEGAVGVPLLLVDGVVGGTWSRRRRGRRLDVVVDPFVTLSPAQGRELEAEAERVAATHGAELELALGSEK